MISGIVRVERVLCFHKFPTNFAVMALGGKMNGFQVVSRGRSVETELPALAAFIAALSSLDKIVEIHLVGRTWKMDHKFSARPIMII